MKIVDRAARSVVLTGFGRAALFAFAGAISMPASAALFSITPFAFDFGDVSLGSSSPEQTVTITNVSGVAQTLSLAGGGAGVFGGVQNCQGQTLNPGASCQVRYAFSPAALGAASGTTSLIVNGQTASFAFEGNGIDTFRIGPVGFDFGTVAAGGSSAPQTVTVTNVSMAPQTLSLAGGGAGVFGGVQNCQGTTLAPGASCQVSYTFSPAPGSSGTVTGSTSLLVNGQSASFSFSGSVGGTSQPFLVTPVAFNFGDVSVGGMSEPQTVTVTNVSGVPQTLSLAGGGAGVFGGVQNCQGRTLAPGASCQVTYMFSPTSYGVTTGSTSLEINGQTASFSFRGNGIDPFLISPIGFDFGEVMLGMTSLPQVVDILNVSGSPQTLSLAGGGAGVFGGVQNCQGRTLAPNEACQVTYAFTPAALGAVSGSTSLMVNQQSASFRFLGVGIGPAVGVPEPGSWALLGLGLAALAAARRRRVAAPG